MRPFGVSQGGEGKEGPGVPPCSRSGEGLALPLICPRAPLAGVNLLVGTENGLMLLDRSGQGKVYGLIGRRRFQQMDVLEGLNLLITISGWGEAVARRRAQCLGGGLSPVPQDRTGRWGPHFLTPRGPRRMVGRWKLGLQ